MSLPPSARTLSISVEPQTDGNRTVTLAGWWTLSNVSKQAADLRLQLLTLTKQSALSWDGMGIEALDSAGATLLWRVWERRLPEVLLLRPEHLKIFERLAAADKAPQEKRPPPLSFANVHKVGVLTLGMWAHVVDFIVLLGQFLLNIGYLLRYPRELPHKEISANLYKAGVRAMPVTALVGFLIGVVLSYLSSLQLRQFGAEVFIINILGLGVIRELGPMLVAVLVAGRSGSAMTAQLGVMRVTEEIDALSAMGVMRSLRLIFPKVVALAIAMPLLVLWTVAAALAGGMVCAELQLDISYAFFFSTLPKVVPVANVWIALAKGVAFGIAIALVACHFGLRVRPNTESLSANTTSSVVSAITVVIMLDAVFAIFTRGVGIGGV